MILLTLTFIPVYNAQRFLIDDKLAFSDVLTTCNPIC
jgi:hypothetical protein